MPHRVHWDPAFSVGREVIDAQHQSLLAQCIVLAGHCQSGEGEPGAQTFNPAFAQAFERLQALVREHFKTEASLLSACGQADLEDHQFECDEFEYLAGEIATQEHFDRLELQRFLALWCVGHVTGSAAQLRGLMASGGTPG